MSTELTTVESSLNGASDVQDYRPRSFDQAQRFCEILAQSELVPKIYQGKPADVFVAVQYGAEIGLAPMQALQNLSVINGRPALWGDAPLALVQGSGKLEWIKEWHEGETAYCETQRKGYPTSHRQTFSHADAVRMGLAGKQGPWQQCPARMRQLRARGFNLRDQFADVLKGIGIAEEIVDMVPATTAVEIPMPTHEEPPTSDSKGNAILDKIKKTTPVPPEANQTTAADAVTDSAAGPSSAFDPWLSQVLDCEDILRSTPEGTRTLRAIRAPYKLEPGAYQMLPDEQKAEYLSTLVTAVERIQKPERFPKAPRNRDETKGADGR